MTRTQKNRIRALLLLLVFSLNTLAGFACSVGMNLGYNRGHHHGQGGHGPGKHVQGKQDHGKGHLPGATGHTRHHDSGAAVHVSPVGKEDCCSGDVTRLARQVKKVADETPAPEVPVLMLSDISLLLLPTPCRRDPGANSRFQFVRRSCFLNDTDIRIAIRSFQI
ncbi:hypothetical protein V9K67_00675 [Paraflavisolibacter sp. H34]|uniref:hypothetical protein n=1 Tax=Huijunlia imazamoxiresistens TaxID=3127457 RepID=UPI0030161F3D